MSVLSTSMVIARRELTVRSSGAVATSDLRPLTCAVIREGIRFIADEGLLEKPKVLGQELHELLQQEVLQKYPDLYHEARGLGVMHGIELSEKTATYFPEFRNTMIRSGVYVEFMAGAGKLSRGGRYVLPTMRIAPSLITNRELIHEIVERIQHGSNVFRETYQ